MILNLSETANNSNNEQLPQEVVQQNAFRLISGFKQTLRKNISFREALSEYYFGQLDRGYKVDPERTREVTFLKKRVWWTVEYKYTENSQQLDIQLNNPNHDGSFKMISLFLESSRFEDHVTTQPAMIHAIGYEELEEHVQPILQINTNSALENAEKILAFLNS